MIVAIDGPGSSGKGTVARIIAKKCNLTYIDTGAMYRAIAYATILENIPYEDGDKIVELAKKRKISFNGDNVYLDDLDVTKEIRTQEVTRASSLISKDPRLREVMVDLQREMSKKGAVMEGRDITTVVFPNADFKFYLDASLEVRAKRRYKEDIAKNMPVTYEEIYEAIKTRDYNDTHREFGALMRTEDQVYIDSTELTIDEVVDAMMKIIEGE